MARTARDLLDEPAGLNIKADEHPRELWTELMKSHHSRVVEALTDRPLDPLVRALRLDVRRELALARPDLGLKRDRAVVLLRGARHPVHEGRPVLELSELVIDSLDRQTDIHALLDRHAATLTDTGRAFLTATATERQNVLSGVLQQARRPARLIDLALQFFGSALA
jgi:hypothetical protein